MSLLHSHTSGISGMQIGEIFHGLWHDVILHGILDTLKIIVFLFLAYLLMEFIEHKASDRLFRFIKKSGSLGPLVGGALGAVPQCGFSAVTANLYTGRVVTLGTLVAVFISTSDEMLPIMISEKISPAAIFPILAYKLAVGVFVGFIIDLTLRFMRKPREEINIDEICENDNCHCERGILFSALHHTLTIGAFILVFTIAINALIFFIGEENLSALIYDKFFFGHLIAAIFGLIPNCAASVLLTTLCTSGYITAGTMISGLISGAGVGLLVLLRINKRRRENFAIIAILVLSGLVFGMLADLFGFSQLLV